MGMGTRGSGGSCFILRSALENSSRMLRAITLSALFMLAVLQN